MYVLPSNFLKQILAIKHLLKIYFFSTHYVAKFIKLLVIKSLIIKI